MTPAPDLALRALLAGDIGVGLAVLDASARYVYVNSVLAAVHDLPEGEHSGRRVGDVVGEEQHAVATDLIARVRAAGRPVEGVMIERDGRIWETGVYPLDVEGAWVVGVVAVDRTDRERALRVARRSASWNAALAALSQRSLELDDPQVVMDEAVELLARELGAEFVEVLQLVPEEELLELRSGHGFDPSGDGPLTVPAGFGSQAGLTLEVAEPVVVADLETETRFTGPAMLVDHGVRSGITVAISAGSRTWGVLGMPRQDPALVQP